MSEPLGDPHAGSAEGRADDLLPEKVCLWLSELSLVAMVVLTAAEVVARSVFNFSLEITDEVGGYLLAALTFLSLPVALTGNAYHRVEFIMARLTRNGRALARLVFNLINLAFVLILDWQIIRLVLRSFEQEDRAGTLLGTPLWIPQTAMIVGTTVLAFTLLRVILIDGRLVREGRAGA